MCLNAQPTGPFVVHKHIDMKPLIGTSNTGDQTVFTDEDTGKDYLIYSYGKGRHISITSAGKRQVLRLKDFKTDDRWHQAQMCVTIGRGDALLTIHARGKAMAQCLINDVCLVKATVPRSHP